ncbi:MAG: hypothetical protein HFI10_16650 [Lachnospiraceae bacterium]|jgi:hypothetical protein|nr:hypothetical protein [Lachnospiraceae bacterium]
MGKAVVESKFSKGKVNNEIELCKVNDKTVKTAIERALLGERISYFIKWEKPGFFSGDKKDTCTFCVNEWQAEAAEKAISDLGDEMESKIKYVMKRIEKTLF